MTLVGHGGATTDTDSQGIHVRDGIVTSLGANVSLTGFGGNAGSGTALGVLVNRNSTETKVTAGGSGNVTVIGTGGSGSGNLNVGVAVAGGIITSSGGNVTVTGIGSGNASGKLNIGVGVVGGTIEATGSGTLTVTGTGGAGAAAHGIDFNITGAFGTPPANISTVNGTLSVIGTPGAGDGSFGINLWKNGTISTTGTGNASLKTDSLEIDVSDTPGTINVGANAIKIVPATNGVTLDLSSAEYARISAGRILYNGTIDGKTPTSNPTVDLSVSTNAASESGQTKVTVTATASAAVSGDQTVTVGVSGSGITSNDYTLSGTTITIPSGKQSGSVTFTVQDDSENEGSETATISISNPSSGVTLGKSKSQNVVITDNDGPTSVDIPQTGTGPVTMKLVGGNIVITQDGKTLAQIPASDQPLQINGTAANDDVFILDLSGGDPTPTGGLIFNGGAGGNDVLRIVGTGQDATYSPDSFVTGNGVIEVNGKTITFVGLEPVDMFGFGTVTLNLPNGDDILTVTNDVDFTFGGMNPAIRVAGTSGGVAIETVAIWSGSTLVIDTTLNSDGDDSITINGADLTAANISNLTINTGSGSDAIAINGDVTLDGNLAMTTAAGAITQAGSAVSVGGTTTINTGSADIALTSATNDFVGPVTLTGANISIADANDMTLTSVTASGDVLVTTDDALTLIGTINAGDGTITLNVNTDGAGADDFTMLPGSVITTLNSTSDAVVITVNNLGGGTGDAIIQLITTAKDCGPTLGRVTIDANGGAVVDGNAGSVNVVSGATILLGQEGVGSAIDTFDTEVGMTEGVGGSGGFYVLNTGNLTVGGLSATIGISTTTGDIDLRTTGSLTVTEDVDSTGATGNILLSAIESAGFGSDLTINDNLSISSPGGSIQLLGGDNVTIGTGGSISAPTGSITISGDSGDLDPDGAKLTVAAQLVSGLGTAINGGNDNDKYSLTYPTGVLNSGTVTIGDTGGTDAATVSGSSAADTLFFTTAEPPTTATTEQVTRGDAVSEPIILPSGLESFWFRGGDGADTFTVQPSKLFPVTVDGGNPGVALGDTLVLDTFSNTFSFDGKTVLVNGGTPAFKGVTIINIEDMPLEPVSNGPVQRYDFNARTVVGGVYVSTPTQTGYTGVQADTLYSQGLGYGWNEVLVPVLNGTNSGPAGDLVNDGVMYSTGTSEDWPLFKADIGNGWVQVTVNYGHPEKNMDGMRIVNVDTNEYVATGLSTDLGESASTTFFVLVTDGSVDLRFEDVTNSRMMTINGIDLRPANLFTVGFSNAPTGALNADGTSVDLFDIVGGPINGLFTVSVTAGTIVSSDADLRIDGFQVATDGTGAGTIQIQRPSAVSTSLVGMKTPTGEDIGCVAIDYARVNSQLFDFNTTESATEPGYTPVLTTNAYSSATGYGWLSQPNHYSMLTPLVDPHADLLNDGHRGSTADTFRVDLDNGEYEVHVYMGDNGDHVGVSLALNGTTVLSNQPLSRTKIFDAIYTVTVSSEQLDLTFSANDKFFNDPYWVVNAIEIRPLSTVTPIYIEPVGDVPADGSTITTVQATSLLAAGAQVTVTSTLGTITSADVNPNLNGIQVTVGGGGAISFDIQSPTLAGVPQVEWKAVDGSAHGIVYDEHCFEFVILPVRRLDFNRGFSSSTMSATAAGFFGVPTNSNYQTVGWGWSSQPGDFTTPVTPSGVTTSALYSDGHHIGAMFDPRTLYVQAGSGTTYDVRAYLGSFGAGHDPVYVTAEGTTQVATITDWNEFTIVTILGATDINNDGFIGITFEDRTHYNLNDIIRPFGGRNGWAIVGLDIADQSVGLPVAAPLLAAVSQSTAAKQLSLSDVNTLLPFAKSIIAATNLSSAQQIALAAAKIEISDLSQLGALGLTEGLLITLDDDGAGFGWNTSIDAVASDEYDLLTVLAHELSHAIGCDHSDSGLMAPVLDLGVRLVDLDGVFASGF